eukprot:513772-Amphidinium_carterae.1
MNCIASYGRICKHIETFHLRGSAKGTCAFRSFQRAASVLKVHHLLAQGFKPRDAVRESQQDRF